MPHVNDEQISAYLDAQLSAEEKRVLEAHFRECDSCRSVRNEHYEISSLFRKAERYAPSPFLWDRIAADINKEPASAHHWISSLTAGLRKHSWSFGLASAALVVLMIAGIAVFRGNGDYTTDQAALADIDRTHQTLAALDPDTYNPFGSELPRDFDTNPFRSLRLSGEKPEIRSQSRGVY
jgi:anti-sigma factor RsiW